jgi:hypothetical protein
MTNITYYDAYEIRITMRSDPAAALEYTAAKQRVELTLI